MGATVLCFGSSSACQMARCCCSGALQRLGTQRYSFVPLMFGHLFWPSVSKRHSRKHGGRGVCDTSGRLEGTSLSFSLHTSCLSYLFLDRSCTLCVSSP